MHPNAPCKVTEVPTLPPAPEWPLVPTKFPTLPKQTATSDGLLQRITFINPRRSMGHVQTFFAITKSSIHVGKYIKGPMNCMGIITHHL